MSETRPASRNPRLIESYPYWNLNVEGLNDLVILENIESYPYWNLNLDKGFFVFYFLSILEFKFQFCINCAKGRHH